MPTRKDMETAQRNNHFADLSERSRKADGEGQSPRPDSRRQGDYYHIVVKDKNQFTSFRFDDVGTARKIQCLAGRDKSGGWDIQKWIVEKDMAHLEGDTLVADHPDARTLFKEDLPCEPKLVNGDVFEVKPTRGN